MTLEEVLQRAKAKDPSLTAIHIDNQKIGPDGIKQLATVLPDCHALSSLWISYNNLGTEGWQALASVLPECCALSFLDLRMNNLESEGAQALARVLPECRALSCLHLDNNYIGVKGAQALASVLPECCALSFLSLGNNKLGAEGAQALARVLPECRALSYLELHNTNLGIEGAQALARVLPECRALSFLGLGNNNLGAEGAQALASVLPECRALIVLTLVNNNLGAEEEKKLYQTIDPILERNQKRFDELMNPIVQGDLSQINTLYKQGISLFSLSRHKVSPYLGYSPLLLAVSKGKLVIVEWLLEKGCRDTQRAWAVHTVAPQDRGKTALEIAKARGFEEIVALLQAANVPEAKKEAPVVALQPKVKPVVSPQPVMPEVKQAPLMQNVSPAPVPLVTSHEIVVRVNKIAYKQLTYGECIGKGSYGIVYQGKYGFTDVAIKEFLEQHLTEESLSEFKNEATLMGQLRHPNIVTLYGICLESPHYSLVMELMPNHSLWDFLHSSQEISWDIRSTIVLDITAGLAFLHDQDILHRDLKSLNVLLDGHFRAKISDFGLAKLKTETRSRTIKTKEEKEKSVGTLQWMAPELFEIEAKYTKASDVYSYGMILWELSTRKVPFAGASDALIIHWVSSGKKQAIPEDCPEALAKVIGECWQTEGQKRISAAAALESLSLWKQKEEQEKPSKGVSSVTSLFAKAKLENSSSQESFGYRENVETQQLPKGK